MKMKLNKMSLITVGVAGLGLIACGPNTKEGEPEPVDHVTARQALNANTKALAADFSVTAKFLERSEILRGSIDLAASPVAESGGICTATPDGATECESAPEPEREDVELDVDINDETDELLDELEARILNDAAVEADEEMAVTYLVRGDLVCAVEGEPLDQNCVSQVDQAEIRIVITSPSAGDVDVDVLVGPDRVNPLSFQVHQGLLALEADLGGIKDSAEHIGGIVGEDFELPSTFEGRVRAEISAPADRQIAAAISVLQAVKIADGDFSFSVGQSLPLYAVALDANLETLTGTANIGAVDGLFPVTSYEYDPLTDQDSETSYQIGFHLAGMTGQTVLDVANELIQMTGVGLGPDTSTVSIDGAQVAALDLNPDDGRTLDGTIRQEGDGVKIEVDPAFDLRLALQLANALDAIGDVDDWMLDEVFTLSLDGAAKPAILVSDDQLEVVEGTLTMSLANAGITHSIDAGQCMLSQDQPDIIVVDGGSDGADSGEPIEPGDDISEEANNPLEDVEVGACQ